MLFNRETITKLALGGGFALTAVIYLYFVPRTFAAGDGGRTLAYLAVGWIPYTIAFYALGRLTTSSSELPSMRPIDIGVLLFLVSLLVSLGLDRWGLQPERYPEGHVLPAIGIYAGLALLGWGLGCRSAAVTSAVDETSG